MGTRSFPGVKSGRGVMLTPHPPSSAVGHERVELYLYSPSGLYGLYRASVLVQGCTSPFLTCICLRRTFARWNSGKRRRVTSSHPQLVRVLCDIIAEHSQSVNLGTRYVYTCVGAECGRGRGGGQNKIYLLRR
jgi:hypothetical protein